MSKATPQQRNTILFFDDFMLKEYTGVRKRYFAGKQVGIIPPENTNQIGGRIIYHAPAGMYRMWRGMSTFKEHGKGFSRFDVYESGDLMNWEKIPEHLMSGKELIKQDGCIHRDDFEPNPDKRYKLNRIIRGPGKKGNGYISVSTDGLNWKMDKEYHFCSHISDTHNRTFYNPVFGEYQTILRASHVDRRIFCITSKDMIHWTKPRCILMTRPCEEPCVEYYGLVPFPQEGYFLGYAYKYYPPIFDVGLKKMAGKTDSFLVYSYDGNCWNFASDNPIAERPLPPEHGSTGIYLNSLDISPDKKKWMMAGDLRRADHGAELKGGNSEAGIGRIAWEEGMSAAGIYTIRREGFVAFESTSKEGLITFHRIVMHGEDLLFNISAPIGWVKFQVNDENGVIPGFSFEDCIPFIDDDQIRHRPKWKRRDIRELKGKSIFLQVKMYTALIFAITGDFYVQTGTFPMKSLGDPSLPQLGEIHYENNQSITG